MKIQFKLNLVSGIFSVMIGILLLYLIPSQISAEISSTNSGVTSSTLPSMVGWLFVVCGVILLIQSIILKKDEFKVLDVKTELLVLAYMAILVIYGYFFKYGFLWTTSLLSVITLLFTRCKNKWYYLITVVAVFVLYFVFKMILHVRLP